MGCIHSKDMLEESLLFEIRKARVLCNIINEVRDSASSASTQYYSTRIYSIMERVKEMDLNEVESTIEASKDHWTELEPEYCTVMDLSTNSHMENIAMRTLEESTSFSALKSSSSTEEEPTNRDPELYEKNVEFIKSLQEEDPVGDFFEIDDVNGEWVLGKKIGEGGQATIYEVKDFIGSDGKKKTAFKSRVLKVFKAGYLLVDLRKQWPLPLLHKLNPSHKDFRKKKPNNCKSIYYGRLLRDGRFAFEMGREWGDLRKLLDVRIQHNGNQRPPFMKPDGNCHDDCMISIMLEIAVGMKSLHEEGILHRDLKASNVLINDFLNEPWEDGYFYCAIADFECSIGVLGTGYWRAPEIMTVLKNCTLSTMPDVITPKSDVYSYAMTCYEIITGFVPFENIEDGKPSCEDIIEGKRPKLPRHLKPWIKELICKCWHINPFERPTFEEIVKVLFESRRDLRFKK